MFKDMFEKASSYEKNIQGLEPLTASEVEELNEDAYIYFGRGTCPYCRDFSQQFPDAPVPIKYVNTEMTAVDNELRRIRDKYTVATVPTLIHRKKDGSFSKLNRDVRETIEHFAAAQ